MENIFFKTFDVEMNLIPKLEIDWVNVIELI